MSDLESPSPTPLPLRTHAATHPGLLHPRNEDAHTVVDLDGGRLLVVCDGMGGMGRGDEASSLAVEVLRSAITSEGTPSDQLRSALRQADDRIRATLCEEIEQPGATAVVVYVTAGAAHVAWVGDSRAYLVREGRVLQRTRDHKLVEELIDAGQLTPEQARESALAHVVTRALGGRPASDPPVNVATPGFPWKLHQGDRLLLCSDGVCDLIEDHEIATILTERTPDDATARLVETALLRGGHDNITCIVAVWDGETDDQATPVIQPERHRAPFGPDPLRADLETDEMHVPGHFSSPGADLPTAEVASPQWGASPDVPPPDPAAPMWLGVGIALVLLGIVAAVAALLGA